LTVRLASGSVIELEGICPIEDAEPLLRHLLSTPHATVDWRACEQAHTAVIQILLAAGVPLRGPPAGAILKDHVAPLIVTAAKRAE
jgi:hypothetical protein